MRVADLGLRFVVTTLLGAAAGLWADQRFELVPMLTVVGFFLGFGLASVGLARGVTPAERRSERSDQEGSADEADEKDDA